MTVAFALSGGGNLGPMQAGTILALMEAGIEPDPLVGTSVGALNAAFLSTRPGIEGARTLMAASSAIRRKEAFRFHVLTVLAGFFGVRHNLVSAHQLRGLIRRWVEIDRIEQATTRLAITTTDALTGEPVVLTRGVIGDALAASSAIPGLFPPVRIDGRWLIDGSLSANRPVLQAQALGTDDVYVITTTTAPRLRPPRGAVAMAMNSVSLVTARADHNQLAVAVKHPADTGGRVFVVPFPQPPAPGPFDFRRSAALPKAAYQRTILWLTNEAPPANRTFAALPADNSFAHYTSPVPPRSPSLTGAAQR
jgi:NTE family protein